MPSIILKFFWFSLIVNLLDVKILQVGNIELRVQYKTVLSSCKYTTEWILVCQHFWSQHYVSVTTHRVLFSHFSQPGDKIPKVLSPCHTKRKHPSFGMTTTFDSPLPLKSFLLVQLLESFWDLFMRCHPTHPILFSHFSQPCDKIILHNRWTKIQWILLISGHWPLRPPLWCCDLFLICFQFALGIIFWCAWCFTCFSWTWFWHFWFGIARFCFFRRFLYRFYGCNRDVLFVTAWIGAISLEQRKGTAGWLTSQCTLVV